VEHFLGIEHRLDETLFYFNKTRGFFCMRGVNAATDKCLASSKGRTHPRINKRVLDKLKKFFRPHNERFYEMMGVDFHWL